MTVNTGRAEPDEAVASDRRRPGVVRILAAVLLGCLLYYVILVVAVQAIGLGAYGAIVAVVAATLLAGRITGLRGRWTHVLLGLVIFVGMTAFSVVLLSFIRVDAADAIPVLPRA